MYIAVFSSSDKAALSDYVTGDVIAVDRRGTSFLAARIDIDNLDDAGKAAPVTFFPIKEDEQFSVSQLPASMKIGQYLVDHKARVKAKKAKAEPTEKKKVGRPKKEKK